MRQTPSYPSRLPAPSPAAGLGVGLAGGTAVAADRLRIVLGAVTGVLAVELDAHGTVRFVNEALLDVTGWSRGDLLGAAWDEGLAPAGCASRPVFMAALGGHVGQTDGELFTCHGDRRRIRWDVVPLRDASGRADGVIAVGIDVTDLTRASREQGRLAHALAATVEQDALTGLPNRRGFLRAAGHAVRVAARQRRPDAVLAVRILPSFALHAAHGAAAGDDALCAVAESLRAGVRDSDLVARVDDDLFAVYAIGTDSPFHAAGAAERVREALAAQNARARDAGRTFVVPYAVGMAERQPGESVEGLLARAAAGAPPIGPVAR